MSGTNIRGARLEDAPAIDQLLAAAEAVDNTGEHYNLDDVLEELANPMIDLGRDWLVVEDEGRIVAHARLQPRAPVEGELKVGVDGTVHPDRRRQGIGSVLVPRIVERAVAHARERDLRPVVSGQALSDNADLAKLLQDAGLRPWRWSFLMLADLRNDHGSPPPALPEGYTLSTWQDVSHDELREAHNRAFVPHPGFSPWSAEMWSQWVADARSFRPALSLLARDASGAVAAYLQTSEYDALEQATGIKEAYVPKVGTLPEHGRRGLAGALLRMAMERYREAGFDRAALDVDSENPSGALGIYERAGFRTSLRWTSFLAEPTV